MSNIEHRDNPFLHHENRAPEPQDPPALVRGLLAATVVTVACIGIQVARESGRSDDGDTKPNVTPSVTKTPTPLSPSVPVTITRTP